jgi:predicted PurR-regulated permease PerM
LPGHSRVLATAIAYIVFVSIIGTFLVLAVPPIVKQTTAFVNNVPHQINDLANRQGVVGEVVNRYNLQEEADSFVKGFKAQAGNVAQGVGSTVVNGISSVLIAIVTLIMILVMTFLMLIEGPRWQELLWSSYRNTKLRDRHRNLVKRMYRVVTSYVNGQVLVATIAASAAGIVLFVISQFFNISPLMVLPLAMVILFTSLIPMIGATIGALLVFITLLFNDWGSALVFMAYFLVYQQVENNVIQPTVQSRTVELSALTVFVAAFTGITLFGLIGGLLAIPIAGCLRVLLLDYLEHRKQQRLGDERKVEATHLAKTKS